SPQYQRHTRPDEIVLLCGSSPMLLLFVMSPYSVRHGITERRQVCSPPCFRINRISPKAARVEGNKNLNFRRIKLPECDRTPMLYRTDDLRIKWTKVVLPPVFLEEELPETENASSTVFHARESIREILNQKDQRLLVVVGPCSIHD